MYQRCEEAKNAFQLNFERFRSSSYPFPTLPISYTVTFSVLMIAVLLILWAQAYVLMRWIILGSAALTAVVVPFLFIQVSLLLGRGNAAILAAQR